MKSEISPFGARLPTSKTQHMRNNGDRGTCFPPRQHLSHLLLDSLAQPKSLLPTPCGATTTTQIQSLWAVNLLEYHQLRLGLAAVQAHPWCTGALAFLLPAGRGRGERSAAPTPFAITLRCSERFEGSEACHLCCAFCYALFVPTLNHV